MPTCGGNLVAIERGPVGHGWRAEEKEEKGKEKKEEERGVMWCKGEATCGSSSFHS